MDEADGEPVGLILHGGSFREASWVIERQPEHCSPVELKAQPPDSVGSTFQFMSKRFRGSYVFFS